jgi:periplasmic protein CpxP/Spy
MNMKLLKNDFSMTEEKMRQWRRGGHSEKTVMLLFFSVVLTALVLSVAMLSAGTAFPVPLPQNGGMYQGQGRHGRSGWNNPDRQLQRLTKQLKLTKDQQAKIKPILQDEFQKTSALRQNTSLSREDRRAQFMDIHKKAMDQIRPLLTAEQTNKLQQMEQRQRQRMGHWQQGQGQDQNPAPQN